MEYIKVNDRYYFYNYIKYDDKGKKYYINASMLCPHHRKIISKRCGGSNDYVKYNELNNNVVRYFGINKIKFDTIYESNDFDIVCLVGKRSFDYYLENKDSISSISSLYLY